MGAAIPLLLILLLGVIVFLIYWYLIRKSKNEGDICTPDKAADNSNVYQYDSSLKCVLYSCKDGWTPSDDNKSCVSTSCTGTDSHGVYTQDGSGSCTLTGCVTGYTLSNNACIPKGAVACKPSGTADPHGLYYYDTSGTKCVLTTCTPSPWTLTPDKSACFNLGSSCTVTNPVTNGVYTLDKTNTCVLTSCSGGYTLANNTCNPPASGNYTKTDGAMCYEYNNGGYNTKYIRGNTVFPSNSYADCQTACDKNTNCGAFYYGIPPSPPPTPSPASLPQASLPQASSSCIIFEVGDVKSDPKANPAPTGSSCSVKNVQSTKLCFPSDSPPDATATYSFDGINCKPATCLPGYTFNGSVCVPNYTQIPGLPKDISNPIKGSSEKGCSDLCSSSATCTAYAWDDGQDFCYTYTTPITELSYISGTQNNTWLRDNNNTMVTVDNANINSSVNYYNQVINSDTECSTLCLNDTDNKCIGSTLSVIVASKTAYEICSLYNDSEILNNIEHDNNIYTYIKI